MRQFIHKHLPVILFFTLASMTMIVLKTPENRGLGTADTLPANDVDYYMKNYTIITSNTLGMAQLWFSGVELTHFPDNLTSVDEPEITFRSPQQQIWTTIADKGQINDAQQITLDGAVQINQVNINHTEIQIRTEELVVSLADKIASSDKLVDIIFPNGTVSAKGMRIDFENNKVKLLSAVSAKYEVQ